MAPGWTEWTGAREAGVGVEGHPVGSVSAASWEVVVRDYPLDETVLISLGLLGGRL